MKSTDLNTRVGPNTTQALVPSSGVVKSQTPAAVQPNLQPPDVARSPLGESVNLQSSRRQVQGQVALRSGSRPHQGTRTKKLKTEKLDQLTRLEATSFTALAQTLGEVLGAVRSAVGDTQGIDPSAVHRAIDGALARHRPALSTAIQQAVRGPRSALTKSGIDAMRASGADTLMFHVLLQGHLSMGVVRAEMTRMHEGIKDGGLSVADIKKGLVTADGLLQRFTLAGVDVQHSYKNNGPRDLLLSFASSLHR